MTEFSFFKKIKKTRKKHYCIYCGRKIEVGEKCYNSVGKVDGDFYSDYLCEICEFLYRELDLDWEEGISEFGEDIGEYKNDIQCPCGGDFGDWDWNTKVGTITFTCEECEDKLEMTFVEFIKRVKGKNK